MLRDCRRALLAEAFRSSILARLFLHRRYQGTDISDTNTQCFRARMLITNTRRRPDRLRRQATFHRMVSLGTVKKAQQDSALTTEPCQPPSSSLPKTACSESVLRTSLRAEIELRLTMR